MSSSSDCDLIMTSSPSAAARACSVTAASNQLVRQGDAVRERTLEITFLEPGAEAYAFTFG
jgi:Thioredoxin like C-terminal domain